MPRKPNVPCKHPGCPALVPYGRSYCDKHEVVHRGDRPNAAKRGYDGRWRKARAKFLKVHPLCVKCKEEGRFVKATVVDHIVPHRGDHRLFWDESNWQPLCKSCHDKKTGTKDQHPEYKY